MADRILGTLLKGLERAYQFPSAQKGAPQDMELDLPIQPVQDMTDLVRMSSAVGPRDGYYVMVAKHAHTAVGNLQSSPDPYNPTVASNGYPASVDQHEILIWIKDCWVASDDDGDFQTCFQGIAHGSQAQGPSFGGASGIYTEPIYYVDRTRIDCNYIAIEDADLFVQRRQFPIPVLKNFLTGGFGSLYIKSYADGAGTVNIYSNFLLWCGIKGIDCPR